MSHNVVSMAVLRYSRQQRREGAMLVLVAIMLVILLVMTAFSIDVAYMQFVRTELRTATDAASHAASEALVRTQSVDEARQAARQAAALNPVANRPLQLRDEDIVFGRALPNNRGLYNFVPGGSQLNAVRINGRRTEDSLSGSVPLFMGGILGTDSFEPQFSSTATGVVRDIALVLDRSGSMYGQKIADLKEGVSIFLSVLEATPSDERVSLATYSTTATRDVKMTSKLDDIRNKVDKISADGYTAIGQGLQIGTDSLEFDSKSRPFAEKTIVLMTDGIENRTPWVLSIVPEAEQREHTIHTITFGAGADRPLMREVAERTGGTHRHADDGADLVEAFREIARTLAVVMIE